MMIKLPTKVLHILGQCSRTPGALSFWRWANTPRRLQHKRLMALLKQNANTAYGKRYNFENIDDFNTYRSQVPLIDAHALKPWVDRLQQGERQLLTKEAPIFYATSTGTTGTPKHIPITPSYRKDFQRAVVVSMWFSFWKNRDAFKHKVLYFVSARCDEHAEDGLEVGAISGFNFTEMEPTIQALYAWPYELIEVKDLDTHWYLALHIAVLQQVSIVAGIYPMNILMLLNALDLRAEELAQHLEMGTFPTWLVLTEKQQTFFAQYKRKAPGMASTLKSLKSLPQEQRVGCVFPELRAVFCWKSSSASLYVPELSRRLGPNVQVFDSVYSATEGWCTSPMANHTNGGPLTITSHVYEFFEEDTVEQAHGDIEQLRHAPTLLVDELELGKRYYIVLSTSAGLYRYFLGDLLEVCGFYKKTPELKFVRKYGASSNLVGEKIVEAHVTQGITQAIEQTKLDVVWFAIIPCADDSAFYTLYVEFEDEQNTSDINRFKAQAEQGLAHFNQDWAHTRQDGLLHPLQLVQIRPGSYAKMLDEWKQKGRSIGQLKLRHLVDNTAHLPCTIPDDVCPGNDVITD